MKKLKILIGYIFSQSALIPWMMFVAIAPMLFMALFSNNIANDMLHEAVNHTLKSSVEKKVEIIDNYISERKLTLVQISKMPQLLEIFEKAISDDGSDDSPISTNEISTLSTYFEHITNAAGIANMYIITAKGKIVYTLRDKGFLGKQLTPNSKSELLELYQAFDGAEVLRAPYLTKYYTATSMQKSRIFLSAPILSSGQLKAVFVIQLDPHAIEAVVYRPSNIGQFDETFLASLIDNQAAVVIHIKNGKNVTTLESTDPQILELLKRAARGESGEPTEVLKDGKQMLAVFRYVPQLNMGLLMQYDKSEVFQKIQTLNLSTLLFTLLSLLFIAGTVFWVSYKLRKANLRSEQLLENILPTFVIDELKEKKEFTARTTNNVSILFVDLVDFTPFASSTSPTTVVNILTELFSAFDKITDKYQLEKIKTIGDGYMAVAGLTLTQEDHADRAVNCALEMILEVKHFNLDHQLNFALRAGIDSGVITAGIIGKKKFSYDIWGNAVNRASRMESTGIENKLQITQETYDALQHKESYKITESQEKGVKGIGKLKTYIIESAVKQSI